MSFGIYVHIPYCIQRCPYCDFATYQKDSIMPQADYLQLLLREIDVHGPRFSPQKLSSIYFGGGTPSLLSAEEIDTIITQIRKMGFLVDTQTEITIEINPGTAGITQLKEYSDAGVNRFSVGAQTMSRSKLKMIGREHNELDSQNLLAILQQQNFNYSADLLFALPNQTMNELEQDLRQYLKYDPPHISPYCLTVAENNPLYRDQPLEDSQVEMFKLIYQTLSEHNYQDYEISNFSKAGYRSKHNMMYWTDQNYWGVGLSSHSYIKTQPWGRRFWNPRAIGQYANWVKSLSPSKWPWDNLPRDHHEQLSKAESLSDYCHTALRTSDGLNLEGVKNKFGDGATKALIQRSQLATASSWVKNDQNSLKLTFEGRLKSNKVLELFHFSDSPEIA